MRGGRREGAGRPKGASNKRVLEAVAAVAEAYPFWSPLLHMATVANDDTLDPELRFEAAKAAAPYVHARPKSVELYPDEMVELEERIQKVRSAAHVKAVSNGLEGLAERLQRGRERMNEPDTVEPRRQVEMPAAPRAPVMPDYPEDAPPDLSDRLARAHARMAAEKPATPPEPEPYRPITRAPKPRPFGGKASS